MSSLNLKQIALLIGKQEPSLLKDYLDQVANRALLGYRSHLQWGKKRGENLYTHVLNGVLVLETLRPHLELSDTESRVLFSAFTVHDINKALDRPAAFGKLATKENVAVETERLGLDVFFPEWRDYLEDITSLVRGHSGHAHSGGERWVVKRTGQYGLGLDRINALLHLMRAADILDLSHTLEEPDRKADFLGHLNAYLADSNQAKQYEFVTHRLTELRGLLSNVIHDAIAIELRETGGLIPLLYYPDGIAYLAERGKKFSIEADDRRQMARRATQTISGITRGKFRDFITSTGQGIKVDVKCLELGVPFAGEHGLWREMYNLVQRRGLDPTVQEAKAHERALRTFEKNRKTRPEVAALVEAALADRSVPLVASDIAGLRLAELTRTYYIFLTTHFREQESDPWERIYQLLGLPEDRRAFYSYFDARFDRAYVLARDLALDEETLYRRIEEDGQNLLGTGIEEDDSRVALLDDYLARYVVFSVGSQPQVAFDDHLAQYVNTQHKQCVHCSGPFPTDKWMTGDVRSDITVQVFSNRLRGGPGEPKKYICAICQLQFLLEKLNYPEVRGEKTLYLHLFPYSFFTGPFIEGLKATIQRITSEGVAVNALNMDAPAAIQEYLDTRTVTPIFRARTKQDKAQPYGLYLPRYSETVGNLLIFPLNPAGENETERFLFALWNALVLQRHLGVKVLMSAAAVPPLGSDDFGDLYVDNIPLAVRGLLPRNDYSQFRDGTNDRGPLPELWERVGQLFTLRRLTFTSQDHTPRLVRALAAHPLTIFFETDRLLEAKTRGEAGGLITWLTQQAFSSVQSLALQQGGDFMTKLSDELQRLAEIAWQNGLRGRTLERSSLLFPFDEVLQKLAQAGGMADLETLKAAAAQDIFNHLERIADDRYKPGRKKLEASLAFTEGWFEDVVQGVYGGNVRKLLADEKLLRSAFLFYVRNQIPRKVQDAETDTGETAEAS